MKRLAVLQGGILNIRTITELLLQQLMQTTDQYQLTAAQIALIVYASALHDIGKISIPEEILNKPGGLKGEEIPISAQVVSLADVYESKT